MKSKNVFSDDKLFIANKKEYLQTQRFFHTRGKKTPGRNVIWNERVKKASFLSAVNWISQDFPDGLSSFIIKSNWYWTSFSFQRYFVSETIMEYDQESWFSKIDSNHSHKVKTIIPKTKPRHILSLQNCESKSIVSFVLYLEHWSRWK